MRKKFIKCLEINNHVLEKAGSERVVCCVKTYYEAIYGILQFKNPFLMANYEEALDQYYVRSFINMVFLLKCKIM